jgi:hypothetical protein
MTAVRRAVRLDDQVVASLVLGVAGLFFFNLLFGPLAIGLGAFAAHRHRTAPRRSARQSRADQGRADQGVAGKDRRSRAEGGRVAERNRIAAYAGIALGVADLIVLTVLVTTRLSDGAYISI